MSKSGLLIDDFEACLGRVNTVLGPLRTKYSFQERLILFYILFGIFVVTTLAVILGINYSYVYPVVFTILYFIGFSYLVFRVQKTNNQLLKKIHFNLALVLRNENDQLLNKHGIRARSGYLGKWIEFHKFINTNRGG